MKHISQMKALPVKAAEDQRLCCYLNQKLYLTPVGLGYYYSPGHLPAAPRYPIRSGAG